MNYCISEKHRIILCDQIWKDVEIAGYVDVSLFKYLKNVSVIIYGDVTGKQDPSLAKYAVSC